MPGLTQACFDKMLATLDPDRDRAGEEYERNHLKLIKLFEWERSLSTDADADKTFDRVCRKIEEGVEIQNFPGYCYRFAIYIVQENRRIQEKRKMEQIDEKDFVTTTSPTADGDEEEQLENCFRKCLGSLQEGNRIFILKYYEGETGPK